MLWFMVHERFGRDVGAWLMHRLVQLWCMVDAWFGTGVGAWLMHGLVQVLVHG
jgi:hypothetical protein